MYVIIHTKLTNFCVSFVVMHNESCPYPPHCEGDILGARRASTTNGGRTMCRKGGVRRKHSFASLMPNFGGNLEHHRHGSTVSLNISSPSNGDTTITGIGNLTMSWLPFVKDKFGRGSSPCRKLVIGQPVLNTLSVQLVHGAGSQPLLDAQSVQLVQGAGFQQDMVDGVDEQLDQVDEEKDEWVDFLCGDHFGDEDDNGGSRDYPLFIPN